MNNNITFVFLVVVIVNRVSVYASWGLPFRVEEVKTKKSSANKFVLFAWEYSCRVI